MPRLYEVATGSPVDVATPEEASSLVLSGKYGFPTGTRQAIQLPDGTVGQIDSEQVGPAVQGGAKFIGDDGLAEYQAKKKYGEGALNPVIAGAEGAARTASFGASDVALKPWVGSEHLREEAKQNPIAEKVGEGVGVVAPMLVGDEAGAGSGLKGAEEAAAEFSAKAAEEAAPAAQPGSSLIAPAEYSPSAVGPVADSATAAQTPAAKAAALPDTVISGQGAGAGTAWGKGTNVRRVEDAWRNAEEAFGGPTPTPEAPPEIPGNVTSAETPSAKLDSAPPIPEPAPPMPEPAAAPPAPAAPPGLARQALDAFAAPQKAVSGLGVAAAKAAASHLADLGFSETYQRIGASIARGAVEAPVYQIGSNISDDVFDDHDLTAQSLLAGTGTAALFGAGLGGSIEGALSVAGKYAPPALERLAKWADRQQERLKLPDSTYKADLDSALRATARMSDNLDELEKHWNNELKPALVNEALGGEDKRQAVALNLAHTVDRLLETAPFNTALKGRVEKLKDEMVRDLMGAKNDADRFMAFENFKKGSDAFLKTTKKALGGDDILLRQGVTDAVSKVRESLGDAEQWGRAGHIQAEFNARYSPYIAARDAVRKAFFEKGGLVEGESKFVPKATTVGNFIDRRAGDNYAKFKRSQELLNNYHDRARALGEVYGGFAETGVGGKAVDVDQLAQHIDEMHGSFEKAVASRKADLQGLTNAGTTPHLGWHHVPGVAGVLNASTRMLTDNPMAALGIGALHLAGAPTAALAAGAAGLAGLKLIRGGKSQFIASIAKAAAESSRTVSSKLDGFFNGAAAKAPSSAGVLKKFSLGEQGAKRGETAQESFTRVASELGHVSAAQQQGVDIAAEQTAAATPEMGRFAPNVQKALAAASGRTAAFLASIVPQSHVAPVGIDDKPYEPSDAERANFERMVRTATDPMSALDDLNAGTITPSQVSALETIHPSWMNATRGQIAQKLSSRGMGVRLPYQKKVSLSIFMGGTPTHDSLRPDSMAMIQQAYAPAPPSGPTGGNSRTPRASAIGKLNFAGSTSTKFSGGGQL